MTTPVEREREAIRARWPGVARRLDWKVPLTKMDGHCGAIAFSRTGDPALGDFEDAVILKTVGEVDIGLLSA